MPESIAGPLLAILTAYLAVGILIALAVAFRLAGRLDPVAARGSLGFRLLVLPGTAFLWPLVLLRLARRT